jgi:hypothetical protein
MRAALPLLKKAVRLVAVDTDLWFDDVWVTDSTPVECGRSRPAVNAPILPPAPLWRTTPACSPPGRDS